MQKHMREKKPIDSCSQLVMKILAGAEVVSWHVDPCATHAGEPREC